MNIVIVGCGYGGLETARLLAGNNSILLIDPLGIDRDCPEHLRRLLVKERSISFVQVDVTDLSTIRKILEQFDERFGRVDAIISTVESSCSALSNGGFSRFRRDFELNFLGNLVPIKAVLERMIPQRAGKIVVVSSTSGLLTCNSLSAYQPATWALRNLCSSLRDEVRPYGISVDVLFTRTIKDKHSKSSIYDRYIDPELVGREITRILKSPRNGSHFMTKRDCLLHTFERLSPRVLNNQAGLRRRKTKKNFKAMPISSVLITGASSGLGKELAKLYSKTSKTIYLVARNHESLLQVKNEIMADSECAVHVASVDVGNCQAVAGFADSVEHVDMLINNAGSSVLGQVRDIGVDVYKQNFATNFFGAVQLTTEFLKKERKPLKIVNILSTTAVAGRRGHSCYSASKAALWAFTRSLRRTVGDQIQIMEVLPSTFGHSNFSRNAIRIESEDNPGSSKISPRSNKALAVKNLTSEKVARQIYRAERQGKEIVLIPFRSRLFLVLEACLPRLFRRLFK